MSPTNAAWPPKSAAVSDYSQPPLTLAVDPWHGTDEGLVIGVSGGIDSVVLLDTLWRHVGQKMSLVVAHVNYQLRRAAAGDEQLVRALARRYRLPCRVKRCRKPPQGVNLHDWARSERYQFFLKVAEQSDCQAIAVGHQANDQAETVLWHMLRGSGLRGLRGIVPQRALTKDIALLRPLLQHTRAALHDYATAEGLRFRNDRSNANRRFARARIRHDLLPQCELVHQGATQHIAAIAERLRADDAFIEAEAQRHWEGIVGKSGRTAVAWEKKGFLALPKALRIRILQIAFATVAGTARPLTEDHVIQMDRAAWSTGKRYCLPGPHTYRTERENCIISRGSLRISGEHASIKQSTIG